MGYRLVRAHDYGVDLRGNRRGERVQSKLVWICFSIKWEREGNFLQFTTRKRGKRGAGHQMRRRWLRSENGKIITQAAYEDRCRHYANSAPVPDNLSYDSRKNPEKQSVAGASGHHGDHRAGLEPDLARWFLSWRIPERVRAAIWGISRRYLHNECAPLAKRACLLWRAGHPAHVLFSALRLSASWATDCRTGDRGRIAAAVLAGRLMGGKPPFRDLPTSTEFHSWVNEHTRDWRNSTGPRAIAYRVKERVDFAIQLGMSLDELNEKFAQARQHILGSTAPSGCTSGSDPTPKIVD